MKYDFLTDSMLKKSVRGQVFATSALQGYRVVELGFAIYQECCIGNP